MFSHVSYLYALYSKRMLLEEVKQSYKNTETNRFTSLKSCIDIEIYYWLIEIWKHHNLCIHVTEAHQKIEKGLI